MSLDSFNVRIGHNNALSLSSLAKGTVTLDLKNGLSTGDVEASNSAVNWNFNTPSKNFLLSVGLNLSSGVNTLSLVNINNFYRGSMQLGSLGNIEGYINGRANVESPLKW